MIKFVKVISSAVSAKRRIVKFLRMGKNDIQTSLEAMPYGFDSVPVKDIRAIQLQTGTKGKTVVVGYINVNQLEALKGGESRMFSTDTDGVLKFDIKLLGDGTAEIGGDVDNMVRFNKLKTAFDELNDKFNSHLSNWNAFANAYVPGSPTTVGLPPVALPSTSSTADINPAKIDEIKTL